MDVCRVEFVECAGVGCGMWMKGLCAAWIFVYQAVALGCVSVGGCGKSGKARKIPAGVRSWAT